MTSYIIRAQGHDSRPFPSMTQATLAAIRAGYRDFEIVLVED